MAENLPLQIGTTYTLSGCPSGDNRLLMSGATYSGDVYDAGNGATFTVTGAPDSDGYRVNFLLTAGKVYNNVVFKPQVEVGDTATTYEPYIPPTEYTPAADGTVAGVLTLDPTITLTTDSAGAVLEAEYSRDVNKAFAALQAAVEALQS